MTLDSHDLVEVYRMDWQREGPGDQLEGGHIGPGEEEDGLNPNGLGVRLS